MAGGEVGAWAKQKELQGLDLPGGGGGRSAPEDAAQHLRTLQVDLRGPGLETQGAAATATPRPHFPSLHSPDKPGLPRPGKVFPVSSLHFGLSV